MNQTPDTKEAKAKRFAEIYLYEHCGNVTASYRQLQEEFKDKNEEITYSGLRSQGARYYRKPWVQEALAKERALAQEMHEVRKEEIVSHLKDIAFDESEETTIKDRLAALKQLTDIGGFATQNIKMDAKADIEVVIE